LFTLRILLVLFFCQAVLSAQAQESPAIPGGAIWVLDLDGAVGPATSDYLLRGMEQAAQAQAALIVIRMNTPGGLDGAMRDIIQGILASPVAVATYVSPQGARAASAGTYILYASHIAAMAPATNLGAATPVSIGGTPELPQPEQTGGKAEPASEPRASGAMERKMINDASAYIRGLAELRGRNSEWAETAVREAASLSAEEALAQNVIDLVADNLEQLLEKLEGRKVELDNDTIVLALADAPVHEATPDWRTKFLATITDPNLVLILGMIGFYGIILEFYNPGSLVPGTVGIICLLLAGYSLQLLPVNYAGLALLIVGIGLMVAEAMAPSFGILGAGGIVAFVMGGIILFDTEVDAFQVAWPLLLVFGVVTAAFIIITITIALRLRRQQVSTGVERIVGQHGEVLETTMDEGMVRVGAEIWRAKADQPIEKGDRVTVTAISGLLLHVKKEID
jgi:membrane-bound serine protease (ClpP class)